MFAAESMMHSDLIKRRKAGITLHLRDVAQLIWVCANRTRSSGALLDKSASRRGQLPDTYRIDADRYGLRLVDAILNVI